MTAVGAAVARTVPKLRHRGSVGYIVWISAALLIGVTEILAAINFGLPFTTISTMTGHLERHHDWVELIVVGLIVFVVFSLMKATRRKSSGRLTLKPNSADDYEGQKVSWWVLGPLMAAALGIAAATWATAHWFDDGSRYRSAYVVYGSLALVLLVIPSLIAFFSRHDPTFPTLFRSLKNLEAWLAGKWQNVGPALAWIVSFIVLAGLVILLLHLAFYPYPSITHILNPNG